MSIIYRKAKHVAAMQNKAIATSEPALECLYISEVLEPCAGISCWSSLSVFLWMFTPGTHSCYSWVGCFPSWYQATQLLFINWVNFLAHENSNNTELAIPGAKPQPLGWCPDHFAMLAYICTWCKSVKQISICSSLA